MSPTATYVGSPLRRFAADFDNYLVYCQTFHYYYKIITFVNAEAETPSNDLYTDSIDVAPLPNS